MSTRENGATLRKVVSNGREENGYSLDDVKKSKTHEESNAKKISMFSFSPGFIFMALLALQVGTQPIISRKCVEKGVIITTQVIACEITKVFCSIVIMYLEGKLGSVLHMWTLRGALFESGLPASIYALQNTLIQMAYRHLDYLSFNMLNQTKLLFTALFNFLIIGSKQSLRQIAALFMMLVAATLLTAGGKSPSTDHAIGHEEWLWLGIVPVLAASVTSGVASTLCQRVVQVKGRSTYLMTIEMSFIGCAALVLSMLHSADGERIRSLGFFHGWTWLAWIPVLTNALGGILVGLVTKYSGGVKKGFVVICALIVTAVAQYLVDGTKPSMYVWIALPLVVGSTYAHMLYPYSDNKMKKIV